MRPLCVSSGADRDWAPRQGYHGARRAERSQLGRKAAGAKPPYTAGTGGAGRTVSRRRGAALRGQNARPALPPLRGPSQSYGS